MATTQIQFETARPGRTIAARPNATVLTVVGFDGSRPSLTALEAASQLIRGRNGHLEVVYVAHLPAYAGMSAPALVGLREGFDSIAEELNDVAHAVLDDREPRWHFARRDGAVMPELVAVASQLRREHGPDATIVIVVGAPAHLVHRILGSVAAALVRDAGFALLVVPAEPTPTRIDPSVYLG